MSLVIAKSYLSYLPWIWPHTWTLWSIFHLFWEKKLFSRNSSMFKLRPRKNFVMYCSHRPQQLTRATNPYRVSNKESHCLKSTHFVHTGCVWQKWWQKHQNSALLATFWNNSYCSKTGIPHEGNTMINTMIPLPFPLPLAGP